MYVLARVFLIFGGATGAGSAGIAFSSTARVTASILRKKQTITQKTPVSDAFRDMNATARERVWLCSR